MKYLLVLFFTLSAFAQYRVEITPNNPKHGKLSIDAESEEKAKEKLSKWVNRQKVYSGTWGEEQQGSIAERKVEKYVDGELAEVSEYFIPKDFSVEILDKTEEFNANEAKKAAKKALKDKLNNGQDLSLKEINDLLRE